MVLSYQGNQGPPGIPGPLGATGAGLPGEKVEKKNNQTNIFVPLFHLPPAPLYFDKCLFTQGDLGPVGAAGPRGLPGVGLTGPKVGLGNTQKEKFRL